MGSEPLAGQWAKGKGLGLIPKEEGLKGLQTVIRAALYLGGGVVWKQGCELSSSESSEVSCQDWSAAR